jgi:hypothetical protein
MLANDVDTPENTLRQHLALCDEVYRILQTENTHLRRSGALPDEALLERKRQMLTILEDSLKQLRSLNALGKKPAAADGRALLGQVQRKLLKVFHLDRENEQLLLANSLREQGTATNRPAHRTEQTYAAHRR